MLEVTRQRLKFVLVHMDPHGLDELETGLLQHHTPEAGRLFDLAHLVGLVQRDDSAVLPLQRSLGAVQLLVDHVPELVGSGLGDKFPVGVAQSRRSGRTPAALGFEHVEHIFSGHVVGNRLCRLGFNEPIEMGRRLQVVAAELAVVVVTPDRLRVVHVVDDGGPPLPAVADGHVVDPHLAAARQQVDQREVSALLHALGDVVRPVLALGRHHELSGNTLLRSLV